MPTKERRGRTSARGRTRARGPRMQSLRDLFLEEIKDLYNAEQQLTKSLPKMADAASSPDLKQAFKEHLAQTQEHIERLERIFESAGVTGKGKKCEGMQGLLKEGAEMAGVKANPEVRDAALIGAAQRVEHYEIAAYGTARTFAEQLGERDAARLLQHTLNEEGDTDKKLTEIAQHINVQAQEASENGARAGGGGGEAFEEEDEDEEELDEAE
jgi:ferritin-like metal-binding protein YciE